jgi:Na+-translocating ferredoxin:NAD+ oxidoreductase RnfE subunit
MFGTAIFLVFIMLIAGIISGFFLGVFLGVCARDAFGRLGVILIPVIILTFITIFSAEDLVTRAPFHESVWVGITVGGSLLGAWLGERASA